MLSRTLLQISCQSGEDARCRLGCSCTCWAPDTDMKVLLHGGGWALNLNACSSRLLS